MLSCGHFMWYVPFGLSVNTPVRVKTNHFLVGKLFCLL